MQSLPIDILKPEFDQTISNQHLVVEAETGSGKSTRLPLWAACFGRVLVIEPRRIACTSLAHYLMQDKESPYAERIGYSIKLKSTVDEQTRVAFVTPGVALRWFADNGLSDFDIVMVDEFHERRWDTDLLVALLKETNKHRLIVTSATIEAERLAAYIGARRLVSQGRQYQVTVSYQARDSHYLPAVRDIEQSVFDVVSQWVNSTDGDILVFLPGRKEISLCAQKLRRLDQREVVTLHASVSDSERDRALNTLERQKIVLATNVAETSLTIPNITLVIDSGLERRTVQRNGRSVLSLKSVSKASARQRAGRAGRVRDGSCVRLYGEHAALELMTPPEMMRDELTEAMLAAACCGYQLDSLNFLDPLPEKSLALARNMLLGMQAIDGKGQVTAHGQKLYPLPIDALYADLLTRMPTRALQEVMVDLAAALSVPAMLYKLPTSEEKLDELVRWEPLACDGETLIKLVRGQRAEMLDIDLQALKEAQGLSQQMRAALGLPELSVASRYDRQAWLKAIIAIRPELLFVRRQKRREAMGNGKEEVMPGRNSRFSDKDEAAIVLDQYSIPGRGVKQTLNLATVMLPLPIADLIEMEIGEWQQSETTLDEDGVYSTMQLVYAGRVLASKQVKPQGELVVKPIVDAVSNNLMLPGLAAERTREIEHWKLYVDLGLDSETTQHNGLTFASWFSTQLEELGVSTVDDLELFTPEDFCFSGIPYWAYADFAESYPFSLNLADLQLDVEYMPARKLIYVVYRTGLRKTDPKRWELPNWKGWRIQYKKASRIVDVR